MADLSAKKLDKTSEGHVVKYLTGTFNDGNNWYRKWSDGWLEQGGLSNLGTVSLLMPFGNASYVAVKQWINAGATSVIGTNTSWVLSVVNISNQTSTSFSADNPGFATGQIAWYACGQGS